MNRFESKPYERHDELDVDGVGLDIPCMPRLLQTMPKRPSFAVLTLLAVQLLLFFGLAGSSDYLDAIEAERDDLRAQVISLRGALNVAHAEDGCIALPSTLSQIGDTQ